MDDDDDDDDEDDLLDNRRLFLPYRLYREMVRWSVRLTVPHLRAPPPRFRLFSLASPPVL